MNYHQERTFYLHKKTRDSFTANVDKENELFDVEEDEKFLVEENEKMYENQEEDDDGMYKFEESEDFFADDFENDSKSEDGESEQEEIEIEMNEENEQLGEIPDEDELFQYNFDDWDVEKSKEKTEKENIPGDADVSVDKVKKSIEQHGINFDFGEGDDGIQETSEIIEEDIPVVEDSVETEVFVSEQKETIKKETKTEMEVEKKRPPKIEAKEVVDILPVSYRNQYIQTSSSFYTRSDKEVQTEGDISHKFVEKEVGSGDSLPIFNESSEKEREIRGESEIIKEMKKKREKYLPMTNFKKKMTSLFSNSYEFLNTKTRRMRKGLKFKVERSNDPYPQIIANDELYSNVKNIFPPERGNKFPVLFNGKDFLRLISRNKLKERFFYLHQVYPIIHWTEDEDTKKSGQGILFEDESTKMERGISLNDIEIIRFFEIPAKEIKSRGVDIREYNLKEDSPVCVISFETRHTKYNLLEICHQNRVVASQWFISIGYLLFNEISFVV